MDDTIDLLQIKIEQAKSQLPEDTLDAINAVPWKDFITELRGKNGYTFEQLGTLEIETELVLCGLISAENYPLELGKRMGLSKTGVEKLINDMNLGVFSKIREELIKKTARKKEFEEDEQVEEKELKKADIDIIKTIPKRDTDKESAIENREDILKKIENPIGSENENKAKIQSIMLQKLTTPVPIPTPIVKTEHSLENITKNQNVVSNIHSTSPLPANVLSNIKPTSATENRLSPSYSVKSDPYREPPQ